MTVSYIVASLNRPGIKAAVKHGVGYVSFAGWIYYNSYFEWTPDAPGDNKDYCLSIALQISIMCTALSTVPLKNFFGRPVTFAENPLHPRHLVSITGNVLSSLVFVDIFRSYHWRERRLSLAARCLLLFNFFTGRPMLHGVNAFFVDKL